MRRCDADIIYTAVSDFLKEENIDIMHNRFSGMDGCSTMSGEHNSVKAYFEKNTPHFVYIHCRNHRLALCFAHLIPLYENFAQFDGLLLNLYLLLKNSNVRQSIFQEVQSAYQLQGLKLIKAAVTRGLSHGNAAKRVLDRYETLVATLDAIYMRKSEPAVRGLRDALVKPKSIAMFCFLTDILYSTNSLQTFLQGARLNFLQLPREVDKLISCLELKAENPRHPAGCYFDRLRNFIEIASQSAGARYLGRSYREFDSDTFIEKTIKPFLADLIKEIKTAFEIPGPLKRFTALDPVMIPTEETSLEHHGIDE